MEPTNTPTKTPENLPEAPAQPAYVPPSTSPTPFAPKKEGRWWMLPTLLIVLPGVVFFGVIMLYAVVNFIFASTDTTGVFRTITNVILFTVGAGGVLLGPVSVIAGIVIFIVRLSQK